MATSSFQLCFSIVQESHGFPRVSPDAFHLQFQIPDLRTGLPQLGTQARVFFLQSGNGRILEKVTKITENTNQFLVCLFFE